MTKRSMPFPSTMPNVDDAIVDISAPDGTTVTPIELNTDEEALNAFGELSYDLLK